jgi:hypothetical protein
MHEWGKSEPTPENTSIDAIQVPLLEAIKTVPQKAR